jgi:hypothetical protein
MNTFSVIIPTMWFSSKIIDAIKTFNNSIYVEEIILIDNNTAESIDTSEYDKVIHIKNNYNLYVNPSWNLGVSLATNDNIIISNDDIIIRNIDRVLSSNELVSYELVGLDYKNINKNSEVVFKNVDTDMEKGFGCFMYVNKNAYNIIPDEMKIWYGDNFLFKSIDRKSIFSCDAIEIEFSKTVKKISDLHSILNRDKVIFKSLNL